LDMTINIRIAPAVHNGMFSKSQQSSLRLTIQEDSGLA